MNSEGRMTEPLSEKLEIAESKREYIARALQDPASLSTEMLQGIAKDLQFLGQVLDSLRPEIEGAYAASSGETAELQSTVLLLTQKDPRAALVAMLDYVISLTKADRGYIAVREKGGTAAVVERGMSVSELPGEVQAAQSKICSHVMDGGEGLANELPDDGWTRPAFSFACLPFPGEGDAAGAIHVESDTVGMGASSVGEARRFLKRIGESVDLESVLMRAVSQPRPFPHIVGSAPALLKELAVAERIARTEIPVLIQGESGTGKELVARAMHRASGRSERAFVAVNCSGLPESILDSELFGHEVGAFTGASSSRPGIFESADGGTLFLDEIADMSGSLQAKILRFVQFGEVRRIGSSKTSRVDVRIIAATNRDLETLVSEKKFREDLYYRLNVVSIFLPALRARGGDVPALIDHFIALHADKRGKVRISAAAREALAAYDYPGNVRELENIVQRFLALSDTALVSVEHLPAKVKAGGKEEVAVPRSNEELKRAKARARKRVTEELERLFLVEALKRSNGNVTRAATLTGVNRSLLHQMVSRHGINAKDFSTGRK